MVGRTRTPRVAAGKACRQQRQILPAGAADADRLGPVVVASGPDLRDVNLNDCTLDSAGPTRVDAVSADLMPRTAHCSGPKWMKVAQTRPSTRPTHGRRVAPERSGGTGFAAHLQAPQTGSAGVAAPGPRRVEHRAGGTGGAGRARRAPGGAVSGPQPTRRAGHIRGDLLEGTPAEASIRRLAGLLQADRPAIAEAKLEAVLDEIELRAPVELAKRQQVAPRRGEHEPARTSDPA
jgi:hypothetical protein